MRILRDSRVRPHRRQCILIAAFAVCGLVFIACEPGAVRTSADATVEATEPPAEAVPKTEKDVEITDSDLIGTWTKVSAEECAGGYPDSIEFREGGIYLVDTDPESFAIWQAGDYSLERDQITIQAANDAMLPYKISAREGDEITFTDADDCEVRYSRNRPSPN